MKSYIARGELLKGGIERLLNGNLALTLDMMEYRHLVNKHLAIKNR